MIYYKNNMNNNPKPNLEEIEKAIIERDKKDAEIDKENQRNMVKIGLNIHKPKRVIEINSGAIVGVPGVVNLIEKQLKESEKIIFIEGNSGCGKSSTAEMLAKKIGANQISAGEIFRYLTYCLDKDPSLKPDSYLSTLSLKVFRGKICLYRAGENISEKLKDRLHTHNIDIKVADLARICQAEVIRFLSREILRLAENSQSRIILDGRAHSLDFLPLDLRVVLYANAGIRAERRLKQNHN